MNLGAEPSSLPSATEAGAENWCGAQTWPPELFGGTATNATPRYEVAGSRAAICRLHLRGESAYALRARSGMSKKLKLPLADR